MSELAEVLELMHTAAERWRTLRAAGRAWRHRDRARTAWDRWVATLRRGRERSVVFLGGADREPEPEEPEPEETERWRLWLAEPDRARAEFEAGGETLTVVAVGTTWWSVSPSMGLVTNGGDPDATHGMGPGSALIDPAGILPAVELEVVGRSSFLGRPTIEVVARPAPLDEEDEERGELPGTTHGYGPGADEYRLTVDAERGILLRAEARLEGAPFRVLEMDEVAFDEDLPDGTFAPPAGEVEPVPTERSVPLGELPGAVPFQVLVPERPPFGPPHASVEPASPRFGLPLRASIRYEDSARDELRGFGVLEAGEPLPEREGVQWRDVGNARLGEDRRFRPPLRLVRLERGGTHVQIESHDLSADELLELARSLVPLPPGPPAAD